MACQEQTVFRHDKRMNDGNEFKRHTGSAFHGIFVATGRAETAVAAERDKFKISTVSAGIHGTAERRVATVNHLIYVFYLRTSGMKRVFDFLIIVGKDSLQDIHKSIIQEKRRKRNTTPQDS